MRRPLPSYRVLPLWTAGTLWAVASMAFSRDEPVKGEEDAILGRQRELLQSRRTFCEYGYPDVVSVFPLSWLSPELKVEAGKVSLIPDPKDRANGRIAVHLANATDKPLVGADFVYLGCFLEVKDGDRWRACEVFRPGCGTGIPEPEDLQSGHGKVLVGLDPTIGDLTGELRYCVTLPHTRPVVSESFQGRFSSKEFEAANPPDGRAGKAISNGLDGRGWSESPDHITNRLCHTPEEALATAELDRCYNESFFTRSALIRWKASTIPGKEMDRCRAAAERLLDRPWNHHFDEPSLFHRAHAALTAKTCPNAEFGSPERCRPTVWRYLSDLHYDHPVRKLYQNPERWEQVETIRRSGNPWGVDQKLVADLVEEAISSLRSPDPGERDAAGRFLGGYWITENHLPDERCWFLLDQDIASVRKAAIAALARRGKGKQAGEWLLGHRDLPGQELASLWEAAVENRGIFSAWELELGLCLLETSPLEAAGTLRSRGGRIKDAGGEPLPVVLREPLRRFLAEEAEAKRSIGLPPPKFGKSPHDNAQASDPRSSHPTQLRSALLLLAAWEDPADTSLLRSYLGHPAACYWLSEQKVIRRYEVRSTAAELLKKRNEKVPDEIVFEEPVE